MAVTQLLVNFSMGKVELRIIDMAQALDQLDDDALQTLLIGAANGGPHASLYMPTVTAGPETRQNAIRFKNLLRAVLPRPVLTASNDCRSRLTSWP